MLRHRSAVRNGNQTLGSHEVHVGGRGHGAGDGGPGGAAKLGGGCGGSVCPARAWDDELGAARRPRGRGRGALPTLRSAKATSAPHLYVTGSASARSSHGPGLRCAVASRRRWCPAPGAIPATGAPAARSRLPWKDATRGGRKFIRLNTPPRRWERKLQERYTPSAASPSSQRPSTFTRPPPRGW